MVAILGNLQDQLLVLHVEISHLYLDERLTRLIFPSLLTLSCSFGESVRLLHPLKAWSMPSLQRLTILYVDDQEAIIDFLSIHGSRLLHLHIHLEGPLRIGHRFSKVLEHCPLLERLVIHPATFGREHWIPDNQVLHAKLRCLDLAYSSGERISYANDKLWISKEVLPSLQLVRHFCDLPWYLSTWVDSFEPCPEVGSNDFTIRIFQHQVVYKDGVLLWDSGF